MLKLRAIVEEALGSPDISGKEFLYHCPNCKHHNKKLSINYDKSLWNCWTCRFSGKGIANLLFKSGSSNLAKEAREIEEEKAVTLGDLESALLFGKASNKNYISLPKEFEFIDPFRASRQRDYLFKRGMSADDIIRFQIGFCKKGKYHGRIIIPSFDSDGYLNFFIARTIYDDDIPYLEPVGKKDIIVNDYHIDWNLPIILTEGFFDSWAIKNAVPLLGGKIFSDSALFLKIIENQNEVYLAFDKDVPEQKVQKIAEKFSKFGIRTSIYREQDYIDLGEAFQAGEVPDILGLSERTQDPLTKALRNVL